MRYSTRFVTLLIVTMSLLVADQAVEAASPEAQAEKLMIKGRKAKNDRKRAKAIRAYEKANELLGGSCHECLLNIGRLNSQLAHHDRAIEALRALFELTAGTSKEHADTLVEAYQNAGRRAKSIDVYRVMAGRATDPYLKVYALNEQAYWLVLVSSGRTHKNLDRAERLLREALKTSQGESNTVRANLAEVLHRMGTSQNSPGAVAALVEDRLDAPWQGLSRLGLSKRVAKSLGFYDPPAPPNLVDANVIDLRQMGSHVVKPKKIHTPQPSYTDAARQKRIQGVVITQVIIDQNGDVAAVNVLKGLPYGLSEQAVKAIKTWKFKPATLDGKPVSVYYNLTTNFRLQ